MTRNEVLQRVDDLNQQLANEISFNDGSVAPGANENNMTDDQAEQMDSMLANIFKRGGY